MKLPTAVYSQLGPVPVRLDDKLHDSGEKNDGPTFGLFMERDRQITIDSGSAVGNQLATLMHETAHIALWDSGVRNLLSHKQTEAVCDAIGTYLAAAISAGYLRIGTPR